VPNRPILLTGTFRIGSTFLSRILDQHPDLNISYDRANFFRFYLARAHEIESCYRDVLEQARKRFDARWGMEIPVEEIAEAIEADPPTTFPKVYDQFMRSTFCEGDQDARWGEKTLLQWTNIPLFLHMFPHGQAVHIMRDPRAVLASKREVTWEKPCRYLDAIFVCLHSMSWARDVGGSLPPEKYHIVRYEDVVCKSEETVRGLCSFLGVEHEPAMLDTARFKAGDKSEWKPNTPFDDLGPGISKRPVDRWRETLEPWEIGLVESFLSGEMETFGYEPSGIQLSSKDLRLIWEAFQETPLLQRRLQRWFDTGEGVERYSSDPTDPKNWGKHKFQ
jgi:hypothetical protein